MKAPRLASIIGGILLCFSSAYALDFPSAPTLNQQYAAGATTWQWDGAAWVVLGSGSSSTTVLLASTTASASASITFDNVFDAALYSEYEVKFQGIQPATDNVDFRVQLRSSAPADITEVHHNNRLVARIDVVQSPTNDAQLGGTTGWSTFISGWGTTDTNRRSSGTFKIMPTAGQRTHMTYGLYIYSRTTNGVYYFSGAGGVEGTTVPAGVKLYMSSGNIASGTFQLYGIKK
jgi:hypothetical protein